MKRGGYVKRCFSYDPPSMSPIEASSEVTRLLLRHCHWVRPNIIPFSQLVLKLNTTGIESYYIYMHNADDFVPGRFGAKYGGAMLYLKVPTNS